MLISKANMMVKSVASTDKSDAALNCVHLAEDGTTVAANGRMMMAVGPVPSDSFFPDVGRRRKPSKEGVSIPLSVVDRAVSNLPKDKRIALQQAAVTKCKPDAVELTTISSERRDKVGGRPIQRRFPEWRGIYAESRKRANVTRVCVNRRDLIRLLEAMEKSAPDPSIKNACFIELGSEDDPILLRAMNVQTGQHVVGMINPLDTAGQWLAQDKWEDGIFGSEPEEHSEEDLPAVPIRHRKGTIRPRRGVGKMGRIVRKKRKKNR